MADTTESEEVDTKAVASDDDAFNMESSNSENSDDETRDRIKTRNQSKREYTDERVYKSLSEMTGENVRRYANKAGDFVTGFDVTSQEHKAKRELRAKRFGIPESEEKEDNEEMMDIDEPVLSNKLDSDIRPEALHIMGVDEMSTQDLFTYFKQFQPGSIEWINDTSCNVVWLDPNTARRALLALSKPQAKTTSTNPQRPAAEDNLNEAEDVDFLDLETNTEDKETGELERPPMKPKPTPVTFESKETGEVTTGESGDSLEQGAKVLRVAVPHPKAKNMLLRYATKADKKQQGAAKKSKYYVKYGNPNFGGMKGLISNSMKRKIREGKVIPGRRKKRTGRSLVSYTDLDVFSDNVPRSKKRKREEESEDDDEDGGEEEEEKGVDSEIEQMELEVERLTRPPEVKRVRGMYADEVEEKIRSIRNQQVRPGDVKVVLDARQRIETKLKQRLHATATIDSDDEIDHTQNLTVVFSPGSDQRPKAGGSENSDVLPDLRTKLMNRQTSKRLLENLPSLCIEVNDT